MILYNESIESYNEETKAISTNFIRKKATCKTQISLYITCLFNDYLNIINCCYCLQLLDKISS